MLKEEAGHLEVAVSLPIGQQQARTRWGTHASGEAFDRKKKPYLTEQAQDFIAQQALCVIAGLDTDNELGGLLALGASGFVHSIDRHTCLLRLDSNLSSTSIVQRLYQPSHTGVATKLGLFFINHTTRERLCVQGRAELLLSEASNLSHFSSFESLWVLLHVHQSFFHCVKYIKTRVAGLTAPAPVLPEQKWQLEELLACNRIGLSEVVNTFIAQQVLCFLCTVDHHGQCAVNHRGGAACFLVTLPPDKTSPGGTILLPDYAGNGAFEAVGNILETGRTALVIPNYPSQVALSVSGSARVLELDELPPAQANCCCGAERVVALSVQRIEVQAGDWSPTLSYERARADAKTASHHSTDICSL